MEFQEFAEDPRWAFEANETKKFVKRQEYHQNKKDKLEKHKIDYIEDLEQ